MTHLRQDEIWDADVAARYDTPGVGMFAPEVLGPTVDLLLRKVPALDLGVLRREPG